MVANSSNLTNSSLETPTPAATVKNDSFLAASFLISAAAALIALLNPINTGFQSQPVTTLALNLIGIALVWLGTLRRNRPIMFVGVGQLLALILVEAATQPVVLSEPVAVLWPLRILIVLLVGSCWALLMQPRPWVRRGLFALVLPTLLVLLAWGGPGLGALLFSWNLPVPVTNFAPVWLAVDSHDTVYAVDFTGGLIWVFDSTGSPVGSVWPAIAPNPPAVGPGILPNGMQGEVLHSGAVPTPMPEANLGEIVPEGGEINLCGIAVDKQDNLYTILVSSAAPYSVLKFDQNGQILAKLPLPNTFIPAIGCLAVDADHIYVTSRDRELAVLDYSGKLLRQIDLPLQPIGIAAAGNGKVLAIDLRSVAVADVNSGQVTNQEITAAPTAQFQALTVTPSGEILLTDAANNEVVRLDPQTFAVRGTIGQAGDAPGQFNAVAGIALDGQGRVYVADWRHRVVERFSADGKVDGLLWAAHNGEVEPGTGGTIH